MGRLMWEGGRFASSLGRMHMILGKTKDALVASNGAYSLLVPALLGR